MNNIFAKEMLSRNGSIFKALHNGAGFDFEKDFAILKFNGKFTLNSLKKLSGVSDFSDYNAIILSCGMKYQSDYDFLYAMVYNSGFGLSIPNKVYFNGFSHFWGVGDFEKKRKEEEKTNYFIFQEKAFSTPYKEEEIDFSQRYNLFWSCGLSDGKGRHGISQYDIISRVTGSKFNIKTRNGFSSTDIHYFIDKSGYIVEPKKIDLVRQAKALHTQRLAEEVKTVDFSKEVAMLENKLSLIREKIALESNNITNYESAAHVAKILSDLRFDIMDFDRLKNHISKNDFSSIESAKNLINKVGSQFDNILSL